MKKQSGAVAFALLLGLSFAAALVITVQAQGLPVEKTVPDDLRMNLPPEESAGEFAIGQEVSWNGASLRDRDNY